MLIDEKDKLFLSNDLLTDFFEEEFEDNLCNIIDEEYETDFVWHPSKKI